MSYAPPTRTTVDANFAVAYTAAGRTAVDGDFSDDFTGVATGFRRTEYGTATNHRTQPVTGFLATQFGIPNLLCQVTGFSSTEILQEHVGYLTYGASGFSSTQHGTPANAPWAVGFSSTVVSEINSIPTGWLATQFGAPETLPWSVGFVPTVFGAPMVLHRPDGFVSTAFGTPFGTLSLSVWTTVPTTQFGTPYITFNQTLSASGFLATKVPAGSVVYATDGGYYHFAEGWLATKYGYTEAPNPDGVFINRAAGWKTPRFGTSSVPSDRLVYTSRINSTRFGTPSIVAGNALLPAAGWLAVHLGSPKLITTVAAATGFQTGVRGTPYATTLCRATGFRSTALSTPVGNRAHLASSITRRARFGYVRSTHDENRAYGWWTGARIGQPKAASVFPKPATGFSSTTFGAPNGRNRSGRALHIPPVTRHGTHQMERI